MKKLIFLFLILFLVGCGQKNLPEADLNKLLVLHNEQRTKNNLSPLVMDDYLVDYAKKHAEWMAKKNTMRHSSMNDLMDHYRLAGENIAWNQKDEEVVVDAWMHSRPHKANILNKKFSKVGFGMARNASGQPYWCTNFAD